MARGGREVEGKVRVNDEEQVEEAVCVSTDATGAGWAANWEKKKKQRQKRKTRKKHQEKKMPQEKERG